MKLGLTLAGGNYKTIQDKIKAYSIDTSHFTGAAWNLGVRYQAFGKCATFEEILVENSTYNFTHGLKKRLLKGEVKDYYCERCDLRE